MTLAEMPRAASSAASPKPAIRDASAEDAAPDELRARIKALERRVEQGDARRRAMLHILADYEEDRQRLARQTVRLDASRRALLNILKDAHRSNLRLADSRKAMIHIMDDLRVTTEEIQRREQELREKQEQLVQAGKLATLGELTTGVAHELNNPLNNIGLFIGNARDQLRGNPDGTAQALANLERALEQVRKATQIISHLRTFGRSATVSHERISLRTVIASSLALIREQLRLQQIDVVMNADSEDVCVIGNAIQLEQVFINLLGNARDALLDSPVKLIRIDVVPDGTDDALVTITDSGPGIREGMEQRIFDPFFTTKDVGKGTGLGLSIVYGIIRDHGGEISVSNGANGGATFMLRLPRAGAHE